MGSTRDVRGASVGCELGNSRRQGGAQHPELLLELADDFHEDIL
jgi:hypothetical protein